MYNPFEIPLIMYHSINDCPESNPQGNLSFYTNEFAAHLKYLFEAGFEFVTLTDLVERALLGQIGNSKLVVLTFDDGFIDNKLIAGEILAKYKACGTMFVNPGHCGVGPTRSLDDIPNAWGTLNFAEMRQLESSGMFDIQSHTLTHDEIFLSDRLIDFYTPEKFSSYFWLIWKLFPATRINWWGDVTRYSHLIQNGYPIFEYGRALRGRQFSPAHVFVEKCIQEYHHKGPDTLSHLQREPYKGEYETLANYSDRAKYQIVESKRILERELNKTVTCISFPGDVYTPELLSYAQSAGYQIFMRHPQEIAGNNLVTLRNARQLIASHQMIGLRRFVFSYHYRGFIALSPAATWTARFTVAANQGDGVKMGCIRASHWIRKKIWHLSTARRTERWMDEKGIQ